MQIMGICARMPNLSPTQATGSPAISAPVRSSHPPAPAVPTPFVSTTLRWRELSTRCTVRDPPPSSGRSIGLRSLPPVHPVLATSPRPFRPRVLGYCCVVGHGHSGSDVDVSDGRRVRISEVKWRAPVHATATMVILSLNSRRGERKEAVDEDKIRFSHLPEKLASSATGSRKEVQ